MHLKGKFVVIAWILAAALAACLLVVSASLRRHAVTAAATATIRVPGLTEASGLAASRRTADVFWSHNDSQGEPVLYGFGADGLPRGTLRIAGVRNNDWEALAPFQFEGRSWIAIGDIGNNVLGRRTVQIHVIEEPGADQLSTSRETAVTIAWTVKFQYEDGLHDAESLAADPRLRQFLVITKFTRAHGVYAVPLQPPPSGGTVTAKRLATLAGVPRPSALHRIFPTPTGRYRNEPTDACLSSDGSLLAVLTYTQVLLYHRGPGERWETVLTHEPRHFAWHGLPQAEAIAFSHDERSLFVTGEQRNPLLLQFDGW